MEESKKTNKIIDPEYAETNFDFRIMHYDVDENGNYHHGMKNNWGHKEITNKQTWVIVHERLEEARKRVFDGSSSPVEYYMEMCIMDIKLLSQFTGIAKWRIRRHMKPSVFNKLSEKVLKKYADAFEVSMDELRDISLIKEKKA